MKQKKKGIIKKYIKEEKEEKKKESGEMEKSGK